MGSPPARAHGVQGHERRTAQQIAVALEARGGSLDAYTSRDTTAFQARVLDNDLPQALDVLTDLVQHPVLRASDLELERNVVLEEIHTSRTRRTIRCSTSPTKPVAGASYGTPFSVRGTRSAPCQPVI